MNKKNRSHICNTESSAGPAWPDGWIGIYPGTHITTIGLTGQPIKAFYVGLAASPGAGISMGLAEALSEDGTVTGRVIVRGSITAFATALGGMLHTLPFLIGNPQHALHLAYAVVVFELLSIAFIHYRFMKMPLVSTILQVIVGGGIVFVLGIFLGKAGT